MINLYNAQTTNFSNNGIANLKEMLSCIVTEELNGNYELEAEYPLLAKNANLIQNEAILKVDASYDEMQLFRIKRTLPNLRTIKINANHISYDLKDNNLLDVYPQKLNGLAALAWLFSKTQYEHNFTSFSDITKIGTARYVNKNPIRALIGSDDNSFINVWGGEIVRDNFNIKMLQQRGNDYGYKLSKTKNITGLEFDIDDSNIITRVIPKAYNGIKLPEICIDSPLIDNYPHPIIQEVEYSDIKLRDETSTDGYETLDEVYEALRTAVKNDFANNNIDKPVVSVKVNFVELSKTIEYKNFKNLETLHLGDYVTLVFENYNVKLRVVKTKYDSIQKRYIEIELGTSKNTFFDSISKKIEVLRKEITEVELPSFLSQAKSNATDLLKHPFNGHWFFDEATGSAYICDTTDLSTAKNIWKWGLGGIGFSKNGIDGPFETAWTQDGKFVADFITAGKLDVSLIEGYEQLVQKVTKTEESIENITTTTQESTGGNHLCIDESLEANALEYIIYGKSTQEGIPSIANPSEIKTIPSVRNLLETDLLKFAGKGLNLEFEGSTVKINGTSTNQGTQTIKTKTKLKKGTYTISFSKLGGTLERKDSNDCQLFIQTSDGTTERLTNITGSRLENGENAKTTITLEEDKEIYLYFYYKIDLVFNNYEIGVQIEEGSIAHDYRPSGTYAKIRITGENQFFLKNPSCRGYSYGLPIGKSNSILLDSYDSNNVSFSITSNNYAYILSNTYYLKPNTEYILSYNRENTNYPADSNTRYYIYNIDENGNYVLNQNSADPDGDKQYLFTTNDLGMVAFAWGGDNKCSGASSIISNIMITEKVNETEEVENIEYEPSKENEVLIDLNKPNLFDKDAENTYMYGVTETDVANGKRITLTTTGSCFNIYKIFDATKFVGKTITLKSDWVASANNQGRVILGLCNEDGTSRNAKVFGNVSGEPISFTIPTISNDQKYLCIWLYGDIQTGGKVGDYVDYTNIKLYEGYEDYYELCTDDVLKVEGDNVELHKEIEKIILDGSENWGYNAGQFYINGNGYKTYANGGKCISSHYLYKFQEDKGIWVGNSNFILIKDSDFSNLSDFKSWLSENPITIYYELAEQKNILLPTVDIPLFDGINHVQLVDDIETATSIKFLRKTLLSNDYVVQPQLKETNKNLANTTDKTNQNTSDINATNANLNNNYFNKNQINEMQTTTNQNIIQVRNTVETLTTSTEYKINAINETITNGVPLVKTTSTSFGEDGWSMEKTGEEMSSQWNWQGFEVVKDKGKTTEEKTLVANSNGVVMNNAETKNRYIQRPIMMEKGTSISDGKSVGLCHYYIGE